MIKTILSSSVIVSVLLFIQTTWLRNGVIAGVVPDFALLVIIWVAYKNERSIGSITAFVSGTVCDILSSAPLGYFSFLYVIPAYLISLLNRLISMDSIFVPFLMGFLATVLKALGSVALSLFFGPSVLNAYSFADAHLWIEAALNGVLAPPIYLLLNKTGNFLIARQKPSDKRGPKKR